jgi:hypothetical protein
VLQGNEKQIEAVYNERAMALASVFAQISRDAREEERFQKEAPTRLAEQIVARRKDAQSKAVENIKLIASTGLVDFDALVSNPRARSSINTHSMRSEARSKLCAPISQSNSGPT